MFDKGPKCGSRQARSPHLHSFVEVGWSCRRSALYNGFTRVLREAMPPVRSCNALLAGRPHKREALGP